MRALLLVIFTIFATQVAADVKSGTDAVKLVLKAKDKGLIWETSIGIDSVFLYVLVDNKAFTCIFSTKSQTCRDITE